MGVWWGQIWGMGRPASPDTYVGLARASIDTLTSLTIELTRTLAQSWRSPQNTRRLMSISKELIERQKPAQLPPGHFLTRRRQLKEVSSSCLNLRMIRMILW
jgi:hypothetical protein